MILGGDYLAQDLYSVVLQAVVDAKKAEVDVSRLIKKVSEEYKIRFDAEIDTKTIKQQIKEVQRAFDTFDRAKLKQQTSLQSKIGSLKTSLSYEGISSSNAQDVVRLRQEINSLSVEYNKLLQQLNTDTNSDEELKKIASAASALEERFKYVTKQATVFNGSLSSGLQIQKLTDGIEKAKNRLDILSRDWSAFKGNPELLEQFNELVKLADKVGTQDGLKALNSQISVFESNVKRAGVATKSFGDTLKSAFSKLLPFLSIGTLLSTAFNYIGDGARELKEVNTILTEISKTSDRTKDSLEQLGKSSFASASEYGVTATSYLTGVQEMSRAGFKDKAAEQLAELSILVQAAGDVSMETANDYLLATNAAYGYAGSLEKLTAVLDGQNQITNRNAVAMQDLADATSIAASISSASGVSIEEMTAAMSTMIARTRQSGSEVARAWRAILLNIRQVNTVLEDGEVINSDSMSKYEAAAAKIGVAFKDAEGNLRPAMEILEEMAVKFKQLNDNDPVKADFLSSVGSKLRSNQLAALLEGWEDYEKILGDYSDATGSAAREAEKSANNWQGSLNRLSNSWTSFVQNFVNSDTTIALLNLSSGFIDAADGISQFTGALTPLLGVLGGVMGGKGVGIASYDANGQLSWFDAFKKNSSVLQEAQKFASEYNKCLANGLQSAMEYAQGIEGSNAAVAKLMYTQGEAGVTAEQVADAMNKTGKAMDVTRLKAIALNAALSFGIGVAVNLLIQGLSKLYNYWEDQEKKLADLSTEIEAYQGSLEELYDELGKNNDRLEELNGLRETGNWNAKLQEELNTLTNQNTELERQIAYEERLLAIKNAEAERTANNLLTGRTEHLSVTGVEWIDKIASFLNGQRYTKEEHTDILSANLDHYTKQIQDLNAEYANGGIGIVQYNKQLEDLEHKQNEVALQMESIKEEIKTQIASIQDANLRKPYEELIASIEDAIIKLPELNKLMTDIGGNAVENALDTGTSRDRLKRRVDEMGQGEIPHVQNGKLKYVNTQSIHDYIDNASNEELKILVSLSPADATTEEFLNIIDYTQNQKSLDARASLALQSSDPEGIGMYSGNWNSQEDFLGDKTSEEFKAIETYAKSANIPIERMAVIMQQVGYFANTAATSMDGVGRSTTNLQTALDNVKDSSDVLREALSAISEETTESFDSLESDTFAKLLEAFPDLQDELEDYANGAKNAAEVLKDELQEALNDFDADAFVDAVDSAKTALDNYGEESNRFEQALQRINSIIPGAADLFYDEGGALNAVGAAALSSAHSTLDFIETQVAAKKSATAIDCSNATNEYNNVGNAASDAALKIAAFNDASAGATYEEIKEMIDNLRNSIGDPPKVSGGGGGGKKSILSKEYEQQKELLEHTIKLSELRQERMGEETDAFKHEQKTQYDYYMQLADKIKAEMDRLRAKGYDTTNEEFRALEQEYESVLNNIHNLAKDMWEAERDARVEAIEEQIDAIDAQMDAEKERWEAREAQLEHEIDKYDALISLEEEYADILKKTKAEIRSLDKELATSKAAFGYLDEETRKSMFNDDDYALLIGQLTNIEDEAAKLYDEYQKQINGVSKDKTYELEFITNEFERQYELLLKQYEVSKADLAVARARRELENVLNERNVAMLVDGVWTWVADPEAVKEAVGAVYDAQAEAEDALTELHTEQRIQMLEEFQDTIAKQKEAEEAAHEKFMESLEKQMDRLEEQAKLIEKTEFNINNFNEVLEDGAESLFNAISAAADDIRSSTAGLGGGLLFDSGESGGGDIFDRLEAKKEAEFASGERIRSSTKIDDPGYRMVGSGVKFNSSGVTERWYDYKKYSNGGIIDFTGPALVHGTSSKPEVVFNSRQAANLYNVIANTPNLATVMANQVQRMFSDKLEGIMSNTVRNVHNSKINNSSPVYSNCNNTYVNGVQLTQEESMALGQVLNRILPTIRNR